MNINGARAIPRQERLDIESILLRAENDTSLVAISSDIEGVAYITDKKEFVILTKTGGYIRMDREALAFLLAEALEVIKEWS